MPLEAAPVHASPVGTLLEAAPDQEKDDEDEADDGADHGTDLHICEAIVVAVDVGLGAVGEVVGGGSFSLGGCDAYCGSACKDRHDLQQLERSLR